MALSSTLLDACNALADTDVVVQMDDKTWTFTGLRPELVKSQFSPGELPVRLVLPPGVYGAGAEDYKYTAGQVTLRWNVVDLLLFESIHLGAEIGKKYNVLVGYLGEYVATMNKNRKPAKGCFIARIIPGVTIINYPRGSKFYYNGVQCVVQVDETIC